MAKQIPKSPEHLFIALEDQLASMVPMLVGLQQGDSAFLRDLSTKLRLLVFGTHGDDGILWPLGEQLGIDDQVPIRYSALNLDSATGGPMTDGTVDIHELANAPGTPLKLKPRSLKKHLHEDIALLVYGAPLTNRDIVKQLAEHVGSAHETPGVSKEMAALNEIRSGHAQPYFQLVDRVARWTLELGEKVLVAAVSAGFARRRPSPVPPPMISFRDVDFKYPVVAPTRKSLSPDGTIAIMISAGVPKQPVRLPPQHKGSIGMFVEVLPNGTIQLEARGHPTGTRRGTVDMPSTKETDQLMLFLIWSAQDVHGVCGVVRSTTSVKFEMPRI